MPSLEGALRAVSSASASAPSRSASLRVVADVDAATWARDHTLGTRPDASPYGLHRLADHGFAVPDDQPSPPAGRLSRRIDSALRHRVGGYEWWAGVRTASAADVVVGWDERTGVPAALRSRSVAAGVIWLTDTGPSAPWAGLARRALARSAAVWALSTAQLPTLTADWGVPAARLHHVPFGIDERFWAPRRDGAFREPLVLGVGNDRHRDHDGLVAAAAGLPARLSLVTALPVAVPSEVGSRTPALDHVALRERYEQASVVAVLLRPNRHVSGVTSVLEAQAMGRPVVVTDTPGMRDYVVPGRTAELVPPGDVDAARQAIAGLLADPARAEEMGRAGREFVVTHATSAHMVERLAAVLRTV